MDGSTSKSRNPGSPARLSARGRQQYRSQPGEDSENYIMQATRLRSRLVMIKEPITDRHYTEITVQGMRNLSTLDRSATRTQLANMSFDENVRSS